MRASLVALDPGLKSPGVAVFAGGVLHSVACFKESKLEAEAPTIARAYVMASKVADWLEALTAEADVARPGKLVSEWPQVYRAGKSIGDPNDQIGMAGVAAALAAILHARGSLHNLGGLELDCYRPREWVQGTKKNTKSFARYMASQRGNLLKRRLSPAELAILMESKSHDAGDAVGIGLHALGRLAAKRVISRS